MNDHELERAFYAGKRKSSRSGGGQSSCVEVARIAGQFYIGDSKDPAGPKLALSEASFDALIGHVKHHDR